jgi:hypothetical protein
LPSGRLPFYMGIQKDDPGYWIQWQLAVAANEMKNEK